MTYAGNSALAYNFVYDAMHRLTSITDSNGKTIQYQYDAANRRTAKTYPNGIATTYTYDDNANLTGIQTTKGAGGMDSVAYTHDNTGNRLTKSTPQENWNFTYDPIYRITQAVPTGGIHQPEVYTYDEVGNRLTGQEPQPPQSSETTQYGYDDENRLTAVRIAKKSKAKELAFAYDPFGRRISKTLIKDEIGTECTAPNTCPRTTSYVYDGSNIIAEYDQNGQVQTRYTHGPNIDEPLIVEKKNEATYTPYYYHADGLGTITALCDSQGTIVQRYEYDTFGNPTITIQGNISQPFAFTAREYESETGLYFARARYYDPNAGRFITKDPIGYAGGINQFVYTLNNPVNWIDPLGLAALSYEKIKEFVKNNNLSGLSDELIICLIYKESTFDPSVKNKKSSATGLMQVTTGAATDAGYKGKDMYDPTTNIQAGSKYLKLRIKWVKGNTQTGLEGYGTGPGYAAGILDCEKCLKENPCKQDDCLEKAKR